YPVIDMYEYRHDGSRANLIGPRPFAGEKDFMSLYKQVTPNTPQTFIWHTSEDEVVPCQNSLMYATALAEAHVPFEVHIYPYGHHGLGLADEVPHTAQWSGALKNWLKLIQFI
ncbi:MAG: prolyl oligopeptidase family serine peptidase, partial [Clostridia bacterium]|nr:prolyl oligopeptidase family serine peptidase [Clostridia bacterium]